MPDEPFETSSQASDVKNDAAGDPADRSHRRRVAEGLPFLLRTWWLRDFKEYQHLTWRMEPYITSPVWSGYSDPLCNMAGLDYSYEIED